MVAQSWGFVEIFVLGLWVVVGWLGSDNMIWGSSIVDGGPDKRGRVECQMNRRR
jgi:hypothetical protein